jgi:hypothetical protein
VFVMQLQSLQTQYEVLFFFLHVADALLDLHLACLFVAQSGMVLLLQHIEQLVLLHGALLERELLFILYPFFDCDSTTLLGGVFLSLHLQRCLCVRPFLSVSDGVVISGTKSTTNLSLLFLALSGFILAVLDHAALSL